MALTGAGLNSMRSVPTFGTVGAIAEIVDNSIQWKTENDVEINIIFIQKNGSLEDILITDNGSGMGQDLDGKEIIDFCLLFGGGTNHGATSNLGKFGIGLPYACCSQSKDYHVYSWQERNSIKHKYRNHDEFGKDVLIEDHPFEIINSFPKYFDKYIPNLNSYSTGTIIQWKNCDRLTYKTAVTLIKHIELKLGRTYRYFIDNGISINFLAFNQPSGSSPIKIEDLCRPIKKFDPLFLDTGTVLPSPHNDTPPNQLWGQPKTILFSDSNDVEHEFIITASLAKKEIQLPNCKPGGNTTLANTYYKPVQGISIVRANRELRIHHFNFKFTNGNSDPRHRWWKIEVKFEPISDDLLGVNANKTDAQHFRYISDKDQEDQAIDYIKLRYLLASEIQNLMDSMWDELMKRVQECKESINPQFQKCPVCKKNTLKNGTCINPDCGNIESLCPIHGQPFIDGVCAGCKIITPDIICPIHAIPLQEDGKCPECVETPELTDDEKEELILILQTYREFGNEDSIRSLLKWFVRSNKKHFIIFVSMPMNKSTFFEIAKVGQDSNEKFKIILVNKNHPYYSSHIGPLRELVNSGTDLSEHGIDYNIHEALDSLVLFIITWADTERGSTSDQNAILRFRNRFGINLNEILEVWQHKG